MTKKKLKRLLRLSRQLVEELSLQVELERGSREAAQAGADESRRRARAAERRAARGYGFTLVRDVNEQTEKMLAESRAQVRELEAENYALRYPPSEPEPDFDPVDEDGCPMPPPPEDRRVAPGDTIYVADGEGRPLVRVLVEAITIHGRHGRPVEVIINPLGDE